MHAERALQPPMHDDVLSMFAGRTKNAVKVVKAWSRPETMKFLTIALLLIPPAFAQMTSLPCVPPPAPPPPANAASQGRGRGPGTPRTPPQQSAADVAEIARLTSLPPWGEGRQPGDFGHIRGGLLWGSSRCPWAPAPPLARGVCRGRGRRRRHAGKACHLGERRGNQQKSYGKELHCFRTAPGFDNFNSIFSSAGEHAQHVVVHRRL